MQAAAAAVSLIWRKGGGSDASKIDDALAKVDEIVAEQIK